MTKHGRLIDADALEKEGWFLSRNRQVDSKTMVYEVKKPTEFPIIEPEQCEDAISRKAAIDALEQKPHYYDGKDCVEQNYDDRMTIMKLPSVTPQPKTGKWIPHKSVFGGLGEKVYTCDQCGYNIGFHAENFCPRCGADMREGREDETD